jgi:AcrR family transcriptional regulator
MSKTPAARSETLAKPAGRPRRLTLDAIIEVAEELGLENLSVIAVAARLGVAIGTIYTYVENREELERLVAVRRAWRPQVWDTNQHWSDIVRAHADGMFRVFSNEPGLLSRLATGVVGIEGELPEIENFLSLMVPRGFSAKAAFDVFCAASHIALGAAVGQARSLSWEHKGERRRVKLARALAERDAEAFPYIRGLGEAYFEFSDASHYQREVMLLIKQVASERGETLPQSESGPARTHARNRKRKK